MVYILCVRVEGARDKQSKAKHISTLYVQIPSLVLLYSNHSEPSLPYTYSTYYACVYRLSQVFIIYSSTNAMLNVIYVPLIKFNDYFSHQKQNKQPKKRKRLMCT